MTDPTVPARPPGSLSMAERLFVGCASLDEQQARKRDYLRGLSDDDAGQMEYSWRFWSRPDSQQAPPDDWFSWIYRGGRGTGKTRTGAETTRSRVRSGLAGRIAIITATAADARDVAVEGESGILAVHPPGTAPKYEPSKRRLTWPNGATGTLYSAEEPDRLRGPQHDWVWGDELAAWKTGSAAWDNAMLGLRIGKDPRAMGTTTPRPLAWLKALEAQPTTAVTTSSTYENITNLAPQFISLILGRYEGTRLGAQELHALYLEDVEGALWTQATIDVTRLLNFDTADPWKSLAVEIIRARTRLGLPAELVRRDRRRWQIVVGVDPPGETAECGIVVVAAPERAKWGVDHAVVLDDMSIAGPPEVWGAQVVTAVRKWNATCAVVETNQGGPMTRSTIHAVDPTVVVRKVWSKDSKSDRAEPVSALHSKGRLHLVGYLPKLEDQLTTWVSTESKSPDRLDAMVHAVSYVIRPLVVGHPVGRQPGRGQRVPDVGRTAV